MKGTNNHNTVMYRYPPGITVRRRRRGYRVSLDDRSSQYQAMMAHMRATGYRNQNTQGDPVSASNSRSMAESLVELSERYNTQASRNRGDFWLGIHSHPASNRWIITTPVNPRKLS
jgi:hypothetical protein